MHLIRRAAFRVAGSASTSIASAPRSFTTTSSPFLARSKIQSAVNPSIFRRFSSDEAKTIESANAGEAETLRSAVESSSESRTGSVGTASSAYESFSDNTGSDSRTLYRNRDDTSRREQYGSLRSRPERIVHPSNGVYVGNLLFEITAAELEKEFSQYGTVKSSTIATDSRGLSKGFGYIEFETVEQAKAAIDAKDQMVFEGRRMIVNYMARSNRPTRTNPPSKTLFIGNLAFEMSDADLNKLFRDIRNVLDVRVAIDRRTGQPRGFAHADFVDISSAEAGKEVLDGKEIYGRKLRVDFSAGKERSPPRSPFQRSEQPL